MDSEGGDGVVEDAEDWVVGVVAREGAGGEEGPRELRPVSAADWAGDAAMADVGGDAQEVEGVGALRREDGLARAVPRVGSSVQWLQADRTQALQHLERSVIHESADKHDTKISFFCHRSKLTLAKQLDSASAAWAASSCFETMEDEIWNRTGKF